MTGSEHMHFARTAGILSLLLLLCSGGYAATDPGPAADALATEETHRLGERMYRSGLLSDGSSLLGTVRGDVAIDSTVFSCVNCHGRSGIGTVEGQVASPPVNGKSLFNARYPYKEYIKNVISEKKGVARTAQALRPAYTDESLANAIRFGIDPTGRELLPIMPRYDLAERDMHFLIGYLRSL